MFITLPILLSTGRKIYFGMPAKTLLRLISLDCKSNICEARIANPHLQRFTII